MLFWKKKISVISSLIMLCLSAVTLTVSVYLMKNTVVYLEWGIFSFNSCPFYMSFLFDWMSLMFLALVSYISSMVLMYSGSYMRGDPNIDRFIYLVMMFVVSMWLLIVSPNLISILLGWDGLGLVSYVLVVYYTHEKSAEAGMLTIMSNRVGDVAILLSIALMSSLGNWSYIFYTDQVSFSSNGTMVLLLILAGCTKSAQIPFCSWLPAAMAAPTPVSALVHSSTLVTAGVYLLIRVSDSLVNLGYVLFVITSLTMFMSGLVANFENDLKKIIALSTLSQLSVMMMILSIGRPDLAFFHLVIHALFKALLFMCAGSLIHSSGGYQDIRFMGSLTTKMPLSVSCLTLSNLALCGTPFLAGFYSKDLILETSFISDLNEVCFWLIVLSTGLTVSYTFRLVYYTLSGPYNLSLTSVTSDEDSEMTGPMLGLMAGVMISGSMYVWFMSQTNLVICLTTGFKMLALLVSFLGAGVGYLLNMVSKNFMSWVTLKIDVVKFINKMWFMQSIFNMLPGELIKTGKNMIKTIDSGWGEYYGPQGISKMLITTSWMLQVLHNNKIKVYMVMFFVMLVFVMFI
uniref:NADH dehydrogenase subunit 5 n=1 Tax=Latreutes anoplonyx TaxID=3061097 RepID=UPI00286D5CFA|nr:NADH dehydrogenase subunit 5 [Latreutes anoplonyx]WKF54307.1 NADH dehydrogenase subunit 5 [Latreutes anoplonyx]